MSETLLLYSSHLISKEELASVLHEAGGRMTPESSFMARISHELSHVWITFGSLDEGFFNEEDLASLELAKSLIGGEPLQTCLLLSPSHTPGSQSLAVRFAYVCCQHWPCVVDDNYGKLFSCQEIERLYQEGGGFTTYGL